MLFNFIQCVYGLGNSLWEIVYVNPDITNESDFPKKKKKKESDLNSICILLFFFLNYILFLCGRVGGVSSKVVEEKSLEE